MPLVFEASSMKRAFFWRLFLNDMFSQFSFSFTDVGGGGGKRTPKVLIW